MRRRTNKESKVQAWRGWKWKVDNFVAGESPQALSISPFIQDPSIYIIPMADHFTLLQAWHKVRWPRNHCIPPPPPNRRVILRLWRNEVRAHRDMSRRIPVFMTVRDKNIRQLYSSSAGCIPCLTELHPTQEPQHHRRSTILRKPV